ncbi:hypothetical protein SAMN04488094_110166 [Tropicimonas isoalkanivorans]|uniref:Uncharacterized protein n=1 Tax=Tropicimonas isoalkanivorans TaxID=441112 RepID=A0A1I1MQR0_9RHOB|nr:hypothetical protein SAMN04488094_110166 [Tropicimonas isoalkanivorans]
MDFEHLVFELEHFDVHDTIHPILAAAANMRNRKHLLVNRDLVFVPIAGKNHGVGSRSAVYNVVPASADNGVVTITTVNFVSAALAK